MGADRPGERTILQAKSHAVERRARVMLAAAAVTALVACWWITVALPIPVTSLLPLVLFPLVGVILKNGRNVALLDGLETEIEENDTVTVYFFGHRSFPGG